MKFEWKSSDELDANTRDTIMSFMERKKGFETAVAVFLFVWGVFCLFASPYALFCAIPLIVISVVMFYRNNLRKGFQWAYGTLTDLKYGGNKSIVYTQMPLITGGFPKPFVNGKRMVWLADPAIFFTITDWQERRQYIGTNVIVIRNAGIATHYAYFIEEREGML